MSYEDLSATTFGQIELSLVLSSFGSWNIFFQKQINKQTNKQPNKQTTQQTNKQTNKNQNKNKNKNKTKKKKHFFGGV